MGERWRRRHVATALIYAASGYHQLHGWPGRLRSDGRRTTMGDGLVAGLRHPGRIAPLATRMPPMDLTRDDGDERPASGEQRGCEETGIMRDRVKKLVALPAAGMVATGAAAASPSVAAVGSAPAPEQGVPLPRQAGPGTYESCAAYFGVGKDSGVLDVVEFDVSDQNGDDGVDHGVPADTQVVIVVTDDTGATLECVAPEVTEQQWNDAMGQVDVGLPEGQSLPAWPGPGCYAYPSVRFEPLVEGLGNVVDVQFRVESIPAGHTLVSPTGSPRLVQHFPVSYEWGSAYEADPRVVAFLASRSSQAAADAFAANMAECADGNEPDWSAAIDAVNALRAYRGDGPTTPGNVDCGSLALRYSETSVLLGLEATVVYSEPIVLALPEEPTTTTSTTTTGPVDPATSTPVGPAAVPATPITTQADFAG